MRVNFTPTHYNQRGKIVQIDHRVDMQAYDLLPKDVRLRLGQASKNYSALRILEVITGKIPFDKVSDEVRGIINGNG